MSYYMRKCRRLNKHEDDRLCFCPENLENIRKELLQKFINGWVHENWYKKAYNLAIDLDSAQNELEELLFKIEDDANFCYNMWRNTL